MLHCFGFQHYELLKNRHQKYHRLTLLLKIGVIGFYCMCLIMAWTYFPSTNHTSSYHELVYYHLKAEFRHNLHIMGCGRDMPRAQHILIAQLSVSE